MVRMEMRNIDMLNVFIRQPNVAQRKPNIRAAINQQRFAVVRRENHVGLVIVERKRRSRSDKCQFHLQLPSGVAPDSIISLNLFFSCANIAVFIRSMKKRLRAAQTTPSKFVGSGLM